MPYFLRYFIALNASLAYLGMLTGPGMLAFTALFFQLLIGGSTIPLLLHCVLTYLLFVMGPGALLMTTFFYRKMHQSH